MQSFKLEPWLVVIFLSITAGALMNKRTVVVKITIPNGSLIEMRIEPTHPALLPPNVGSLDMADTNHTV